MKEKTENKDLFVTDIAFEATEADLHKLFSVCGTVRLINLLTDKKTGKFTGCAFVRMSTSAEAKDALNMLDEAQLFERSIRVKPVRPKPPAAKAADSDQQKSVNPPQRRRK
jgi:RNA recognition motif-containing protein